MHRFYVETPVEGEGAVAALSKEESQHCARVLRLKPGDEVCLLDGERLYAARLLQVNERETTARVGALLPDREAGVQITLVQGLPKADKLEMIVQKATELGVWEILPVEMERCVAKADKAGEKKRERLSRIALEAAKQCGRAHVPQVHAGMNFAEACGWLRGNASQSGTGAEEPFDGIFVAWEEEEGLRLSQAVAEAAAKAGQGGLRRMTLIIGPEGGISARECEALKALGGVSVTLGRRILRTETAGLCGIAVTLAALGEM